MGRSPASQRTLGKEGADSSSELLGGTRLGDCPLDL